MANYKIKEHYFISYYHKRYEVSEEVYRVWAYYHNMEWLAKKAYFSHTFFTSDKTLVTKQSRLISLDDPVMIPIESDNNSALHTILAAEQKDMLHTLCKGLPDTLRCVIDLLFFQNMTEAQISNVLGVCQATVSNYKHKALKMLRLAADELCLTLDDFSDLLS